MVVVVVLRVRIGMMGVVVLIVVVGIVVLAMVVRAACTGVVEAVGVLGMGGLEVDCLRVVDTVEVVMGVELVVECVVKRVVRLVLWCLNGKGYFCVALA